MLINSFVIKVLSSSIRRQFNPLFLLDDLLMELERLIISQLVTPNFLLEWESPIFICHFVKVLCFFLSNSQSESFTIDLFDLAL